MGWTLSLHPSSLSARQITEVSASTGSELPLPIGRRFLIHRRHLPAPADLSNLFSLPRRLPLDPSDTHLYADPMVSHPEKKALRSEVLDW